MSRDMNDEKPPWNKEQVESADDWGKVIRADNRNVYLSQIIEIIELRIIKEPW